jgi:hypothetical protein
MPTPDLPKVYDLIIAALRSGALPNGTKITEGAIARVLGINRTTVHLALRIMVKIQQSFSTVSYTPPHKPQRSVVIFGTPSQIAEPLTVNLPSKTQNRESPTIVSSQISAPRPLVARSSTQDVVRCPHCSNIIPANEVRHVLHETGTIICPKCQIDLTDAIRGNDVD